MDQQSNNIHTAEPQVQACEEKEQMERERTCRVLGGSGHQSWCAGPGHSCVRPWAWSNRLRAWAGGIHEGRELQRETGGNRE